MEDRINKLFYSDPDNVRAFAAFLPPEVASAIDFSSLAPVPTEQLGDAGDLRQPDLIWKACTHDGSRPAAPLRSLRSLRSLRGAALKP